MTTMFEVKELTISDLTSYAKKFLRENYYLALNIPIKRNNRLKVTMGSFVFHRQTKEPLEIELAGELLEYGTNQTIIDTLKHELIHYALFILDKPYDDGDPYFENELIIYNVSSTETVNVGRYDLMKCKGCRAELETNNKRFINNINKYHSSCCKTEYVHIGHIIFNGETGQKTYY